MEKYKKLFLVAIFTVVLALSLSAQNIWLNELHYDNVSTDVGEFVEVVLEDAASFSLSDFTFTFYNGNNGETYDSVTLDQFTTGATVDDFLILYYYKEGIQNGEPDGVAISYQGTLIPGQFLSYEGIFTAVDGPANGVTSADIGVQESSATQIGESLQLLGTGSVYGDFVWQEAAAETPGQLNNSQTLSGAAIPTIIVSSPNGGEAWEQGSTHTIQWISMNFTDNVKIALDAINSDDRELLIASTENDGEWEWTIPTDQVVGDNYVITISDAADDDPSDSSDNPFSIIEPIVIPDYTIYDIQYSTTGPSPLEGELVQTTGVVTAVFANYFFIQDGPGAWNGIAIYPLQEVAVGNEIIISGTVAEYNDKTEISDIIDMTILGNTNLPPAVTITTGELAESEEFESVLVKVLNATVTADPGTYNEWEIDDGSGACIVGAQGDYTYVPVLDDFIYCMKGVVDYAYAAFKLEPRNDDDISLQGIVVDPLELSFLTYNTCSEGLEFTISNLSNESIEINSMESQGEFPCGNSWQIEDFNLTLPYAIASGEELDFNVTVSLPVDESREIVTDLLDIETEIGNFQVTLNFDTSLNVETDPNLISSDMQLSNYPNPFNPSTTISFNVPQTDLFTTIEIYNLKGQKVKQLFSAQLSAGQHSIVWNGTDDHGSQVTSGIYFYQLKAGNLQQTGKMLLMQ